MFIHGRESNPFMAKPSKKVIDALTAIPGVGEATAKKLAGAGMKSKVDVAKAGLKGLKAAGISAGTATKIAKAVASSAVTKAKKKMEKKKPTPKAPSPKSTISDTESGVRGDQIGKKLSAPKSVKDMMKRIRRSD